MKISLRDWLATGKFGAIQIGDNRDDVAACFGAPKNWSTPAKIPATAAIWKYGDVEFYFNDETLWMIFADDFEIPIGNAQIELDAWQVARTCTPAAMKRHLDEASIRYRVADFPYADNGVRLISAAGVTMMFCGEDAANLEMVCINLTTQSQLQSRES